MNIADLISKLVSEGRDDMTAEVCVLSEDKEWLVPVDSFNVQMIDGRLVIIPTIDNKAHWRMVVLNKLG